MKLFKIAFTLVAVLIAGTAAQAATITQEDTPTRLINIDQQQARLGMLYDSAAGTWYPADSTQGKAAATLYYQDVDTGVLANATGHDGILHFVNYLDAIGLGKIPGHSLFRGFGQRSALSTVVTGDDVWTGVATTIPIPDQTVGDAITCASTSANDASPAGTGVRQIDIHYITAVGAEDHVSVDMDGINPVASGRTDVRHIQYIHSNSVGSFGAVAAGTITCFRTGDAARVYAQINAGSNVSLNSQRMVPAGKTFYMKYVTVSGASGKPLSVRLRATSDFEGMLTPGIFIFTEVFFLQDSVAVMELSVPRAFPPLSIIKATVFSSQLGGDISVSYGGFLE